MYVVQTTYGTKINVGVSIKSLMVGVLSMMIICGILVHVSVMSHVKLTNIYILKIVHAKNV